MNDSLKIWFETGKVTDRKIILKFFIKFNVAIISCFFSGISCNFINSFLTTSGTIKEIELRRPACIFKDGHVAISRRISERWRLIGAGIVG